MTTSVLFGAAGNSATNNTSALALALNVLPYIAAYSFNSAGFKSLYSNPTTLPTGACFGVSFSPNGNAVAFAHTTTPFETAYTWSASSGFGSK